MLYTRNHSLNGSKTNKKKKSRTEQLKNVISLRINDDEKIALERLSISTSKSISDIMKEAIDLWRSKQRKLCMY
jgi:hypothetical protein